ncbi:formate dehydrogenase [bacterium AH-315-P15]|nr:formate dehydrogenase [bacterium AH-315-P15]
MAKARIYIPRDAAALSVGADEVAATIANAIKLQGLDAEIIRTGSRGLFWLEPLVEVEVGSVRVAYGPITSGDVPGLFKAGFLEGGTHALGLGEVEKIPFLAKQERLSFARCGVIDPLDLTAFEQNGGLAGLGKAKNMKPAAIVEAVTKSGLRGRGGAGFPAGIKWRTALEAESDQKYICCNADEGDSGTFADRMLMEGDPFFVLEGMAIAGRAVGASKGLVYIRSEYPHAIATMRDAVKLWRGANLSPDFEIEIRRGAGAYICGEETSMLESLEGKRGQVRPKPPIPALEGFLGKPTIVNNVLTLAAVPTILANGAEFYRDYGMGRSRGTQPFQLAGNIKHGGLVEKAFGITLRELIESFGGGSLSGRPVRAVQVGGPLGSYIPASQLDVPMDYEALDEIGAMLGHGGIVVFDDSVDMAQQAQFAMEFCTAESCGKCTPCRIGATRGVEVLGRIREGQDVDQNLALLGDLCEVMSEGSLCAMGGLTPQPVLSAIKYFPEDFTVGGGS